MDIGLNIRGRIAPIFSDTGVPLEGSPILRLSNGVRFRHLGKSSRSTRVHPHISIATRIANHFLLVNCSETQEYEVAGDLVGQN